MPSNKYKKFELFHSILPFKIGGSSSTKRFITGRRVPVQARPKGCIFLNSNERTVKKICPFPLERDSVGVPLYELRPRSSPLYSHKTFEIPIALLRRINIRLIIFLNTLLVVGKTVEETKMNRDTMVFLLQNLGFVINMKKSQLEPVQVIEFLGHENQLPRLNFMSSPGKGRKDYKPMSNSTMQSTDNSDGPEKSNRVAIFYSTSCSPRQAANVLPTAATNIEF